MTLKKLLDVLLSLTLKQTFLLILIFHILGVICPGTTPNYARVNFLIIRCTFEFDFEAGNLFPKYHLQYKKNKLFTKKGFSVHEILKV